MEYFNFMEGKTWHYDPHHFFSNLRIVISFAPYLHHENEKVERLVKKDSWAEVQDVL